MKRGLSFLSRLLLVFVLVEGAASVLLVAILAAVELRAPLAERRHTEYDPDLGWANVPGTRVPDMYGPGVPLTINSQGFRNRQEFATSVQPGRRRTLCVGDSFTLGYGVGDDETWCAQLAALEGSETVNMGQGGYGLDQAYLWYARDAGRLEHQLVVFAFIAEDFRRMQSDSFFGYGKPVLRVEEDRLQVDNVPVPRHAAWVPRLVHGLDRLSRLRSIELFRLLTGSRPVGASDEVDEALMQSLTRAIFADLARLARERGSRVVLVYLPTRTEYASRYLDGWRDLAASHAAALGLPFLDLVEPLRALSPEVVDEFFIPAGELTYPAAAGHYTAEGNAWVARQIRDGLAALAH